MRFVGSRGRGARLVAWAKAAGIGVAVVTATTWLMVACGGPFETCDPVNWGGGVENPAFLHACCDPEIYDGGPVTWPYCPNYDGPDASHADSGHADAGSDEGDA